MTVRDLVLQNRSYRRFHEEVDISTGTLKELVDLARCSASAANRQPLKFILVNDRALCGGLFPSLGWAAYLKDWDGPVEGERPSAYIIILNDRNIATNIHWDPGISSQSILLGAVEKGLGGCMIAALKKDRIRELMNIPEQYEILLVIALGRPKETVVLEKTGPDGDIRYYRDNDDIHHVPKRPLDELILKF